MDELKRFIAQQGFRAIGICGRAGSGKTTLAGQLAAAMERAGFQVIVYSGDYRFAQDSEARASAIRNYWEHDPVAFAEHVNQFFWWQFEAIADDLQALLAGRRVMIADSYDRATGKKGRPLDLRFKTGDRPRLLIYENAILGDEPIVRLLDAVLFLTTPDETCLARVLEKDRARRGFDAILARTLITHFSENLHYQWLLRHFRKTVVYVTADFEIAEDQHPGRTVLRETAYLSHPVRMRDSQQPSRYRGTVFCDVDGTLVEHVAVPSDRGEDLRLLPGTVDKLREWRAAGYEIVLCTGRTLKNFLGIQSRLRELGIIYDRFLCELPIGPRILINDNKDDELRAIAIPLERDRGIASIRLETPVGEERTLTSAGAR